MIKATGYRISPTLPVWFFVSLCVAGIQAAEPEARSDGISVERIETGYDGYYKLGCWSPATVTVRVDRAMSLRLSVEVQEPDGSWTLLPGPLVAVPKAGSHRFHALFKNGRIDCVPRFHFDEGENRLLSGQLISSSDTSNDRAPLEQSALLVATLGKPAGFMQELDETQNPQDAPDNVFYAAQLESQEQLPSNFDAYEGLDVLVLAGPFALQIIANARLHAEDI